MPDIIKGTKRKTPLSGGGAYVDYGGGKNTVQTPGSGGIMTRAAGKVPALSRDVLGGSGGYQIGRLQGNRSAGSSASGTGVSGSTTESAVQEEIKRRVSNAAQNVQNGTYGGDNGSGVSVSTPSATGGSYGGSDYDTGGSDAMSYEDYYKKVGGDVYESDLQKAIAARVQQAADTYNRQKEQAKTDYEDASRQAYINNMLSQRNLDQQMAASGVYGGMADSQRIALDASYQNEVSDLERQYIETLADLGRPSRMHGWRATHRRRSRWRATSPRCRASMPAICCRRSRRRPASHSGSGSEPRSRSFSASRRRHRQHPAAPIPPAATTTAA